jgi:hypothetical protein
MQTGRKAVSAQFEDATSALNRRRVVYDPLPEEAREGIMPGRWPGFPVDKMPPGGGVIPLGVDGKICYLVDTLGQLISVATNEWNKKTLAALYSQTPHFLYWAWPRWGAPK